MSTKHVFDTSALVSLWLIVKSYLEGVLEYDQAIGVPGALAIARGWKQSVIYGLAILMMKKARETKGEK